MRFAFIHAEKASFPVAALCRLFEISRQGYYAYAKRPTEPAACRRTALSARPRGLRRERMRAMGSPRVLEATARKGSAWANVASKRAMRSLGLSPPDASSTHGHHPRESRSSGRAERARARLHRHTSKRTLGH